MDGIKCFDLENSEDLLGGEDLRMSIDIGCIRPT